MNTKKLKILLFLFALNTITLYLYLSSHHDFFRHKLTENRPYITVNHTHTSLSVTSHSHTKPWPILPSYLPWSQNPNVKPRSCEAYFGNGFTRRVDVLQPSPDIRLKSSSGDGWFRCFYSETLQSSVCEAGRIRMVPEKILMSKGGEKLEEVIGRREEDELPRYQAGAFDIETNDPLKREKNLVDNEFLNKYIPRGEVYMHTMRDLIGSIKLVGEDKFQCSEWIEEPTLLLTRFEYANMFHTVTDWYSAYTASRVTGLPNRPHLVFVDGHCQTQLEETWKALFSSLRYAKNFTKPVCFRHAIITPLGYETALFKGLSENIQCHGASSHELWQNPNDQKTARLSEFGEMIRASFGFRFDRPKVGPTHNVLFVRREDYLAHPRHGGKVESRLINEEEVFNAIKNWSKNWLNKNCEVNIINGLFAHMTLKEQVRAIQDASVIIGAHGAGLTHIVSAMGKSVILEIISFEYRRPHFALIAQWKGLEYHAINLEKSYADPGVVIDSLARILTSLGC